MGRGVVNSEFQVTGMIEGFWRFEIFDSGFFVVGKPFWGWLDLSRNFGGVLKNQLKVRGCALAV